MQPIVLGIETSCDETAIGIVKDRTLLANVISSSMDEHARFGGVVPEIASRAHLEAFLNVLRQALQDANVKLSDVDAIAVTEGPGLIGALLVGVAGATGLASALDKPLYGVNHLASHIAVDLLNHEDEIRPTIALLVSGGHSSILQVNDVTSEIKSLGQTVDDAAGEAFQGAPTSGHIGQSGDAAKNTPGPWRQKDGKDQPTPIKISDESASIARCRAGAKPKKSL